MRPKHGRRYRGRHGVSEIVSTLLLVAIVVSLGVLVFTFASSGLGSLTGSFTGLMSGQGNAAAEHFTVEQVTFTPPVGGFLTVTLTNSQTTATSASFQQEVTWDPATYSAYESSSLGNVRFCTTSSCTTQLYSWLESCGTSATPSYTSCTSGSAYAIAWVNLGSLVVPATGGGTLTIYMVFGATTTNFDGVYWGESPQLSSTYGQYDNGAYVFAAYFNGNTATSSFSVTPGGTYAVAQSVGFAGPNAGTINAIHVTGAGAANPDTSWAFNTAMTNAGIITEASFYNANPGTGSGIGGLADSGTASGVLNGIGVGDGAGTSYFDEDTDVAGAVTTGTGSAGAGTATWLYSSLTYASKAETSFYAQITPALYGTPGQTAGTGYSHTDTVANPLAASTNLYFGTWSATSGGFPLSMYYNFMRARLYPPAGVMPATSLGTATPSTTTGADVYVRNVGTISSTLVSVYVVDQSTGTFVGQFPISTVLNVGTFVDVPYTTVDFSYSHGQTYSFTVTSILGNSVTFDAKAA